MIKCWIPARCGEQSRLGDVLETRLPRWERSLSLTKFASLLTLVSSCALYLATFSTFPTMFVVYLRVRRLYSYSTEAITQPITTINRFQCSRPKYRPYPVFYPTRMGSLNPLGNHFTSFDSHHALEFWVRTSLTSSHSVRLSTVGRLRIGREKGAAGVHWMVVVSIELTAPQYPSTALGWSQCSTFL
jgi:hypothetical protein